MNESDSYRERGMLLLNRNIWLLTMVAALVVAITWIHIMVGENLEFSFSLLIDAHRDHPFLVLFDLLPLYVLLILLQARKSFMRERRRQHREFVELKRIHDQNSGFARQLSEGENPELFEGMLDTELGQALKMIQLNIKSNRRKEKEITWITEGKDMISRILRLHDQVEELSYQILKSLNRYIDSIQGAMYVFNEEEEQLENVALFAYNRRKYLRQKFSIGEGLVGQCAFEMDYIYRTEIPDDYVTVTSGILGDQKPRSIVLIPLITNEKLQGVMEFAFLEPRIKKLTIQFLLELGEILARTIYNLKVNEKTRTLLEESRKMTDELRMNEQILQENAEEMKTTQEKLQQANVQLQKKIEEAQNATNRLHWLLENASEIIAIYDRDHQLSYISPSVQRILGFTPEEMMQGKDFERIDQRGSLEIMKAFDFLKSHPEEFMRIEYTFLKRDGSRTHLQSTIRNRIEDPSISGYIFNTRDITESRMIEKEQRLKTRMQSLSENSLDLILRLSMEGLVHYVNPIVEDYTGISASSMLNKTLGDIAINADIRELISGALHRIRERPVKFTLQQPIQLSMGEKVTERIIQMDVIPEFQEEELETVLLVGHDITEAKRIEAEIKVTNRKIRDSIRYAERIQSSILPGIGEMKRAFPKSFIYYEPRDVISGDFPWFSETGEDWLISAIDCTGHGVPGALLSFIGFFLLNNITSLDPGLPTGEVCDKLNAEIRKTLKQDRKNPETRDGLDIALCKIRKDSGSMEYTGAHRPLYLLREGELLLFKGDRKAVGGIPHPRREEKPFTTHRITLRKGDKVFFFSDGITDQLGGPEGMKYSLSRIRNLLVEHPGYTIHQFHELIRSDFEQWKGDERQLDDLLMIGIEF